MQRGEMRRGDAVGPLAARFEQRRLDMQRVDMQRVEMRRGDAVGCGWLRGWGRGAWHTVKDEQLLLACGAREDVDL